MPMVSAPPGRLSTTTAWPSSLASAGATMRAMLSVALPAACGTTRRSGRSGNCAATGHAAPRARTRTKCFRLRLQLAAHFTALVAVGVHVDVQVARLEILQLLRRELAAGGNAVGVALLLERHDHGAVGALGAAMDVRHGALDILGRDAAADGAVLRHAQGARARAGDGERRYFFASAKVDVHRAAAGHPRGRIVPIRGAGREGESRGDGNDQFHYQFAHGLLLDRTEHTDG